MVETVRLRVVALPLEEDRLQEEAPPRVVALPLVVVIRHLEAARLQVAVIRPRAEEEMVEAVRPRVVEAVHHLVVMIVLQEEALLRPALNHPQETAIRLQAKAACQILQAFLLQVQARLH
jgi:hypothetical protein